MLLQGTDDLPVSKQGTEVDDQFVSINPPTQIGVGPGLILPADGGDNSCAPR